MPKDSSKLSFSDPIEIYLKPEWFRMGYYVYVVVIKSKGGMYFYVGMTGDRKHKIARSPFYRMSGHFMLGKSTQNQIIKGLMNIQKEKITSDSLCKMEFTYYNYLLHSYNENIKKKTHHIYRRDAEIIESYLIDKLKTEFGVDNVFNKYKSAKDTNKYKLFSKRIFDDLIKRIDD